MRKFLTATLVVLIASNASVRSAVASNRSADAQVADPKVQSDRLASDTVRSENNRKIESEYVPRSEEALTPAFTGPVAVNYAEIEDVAVDANPQATPTGTQNPPAHHSHHLRNFIIIFALGAVLLIALAAAAK